MNKTSIADSDKPEKREIIELAVESEFINSLLYVAGQLKVDHRELAKEWIAEKLRAPIDDVDQVRRNEELAYKEVRSYLGKSTLLVQELLHLYNLLGDLLNKTKSRSEANQVAALLHCFQACRYHLIMGNLACLKAHPIDSSSYRRKAIEFCAFAVKMMRSAEHAKIWMAAISNRSYDKYESAFQIMATIAEAADIMGQTLKKTYNTLSQQVHASPYAVATQIRIENRKHLLDFFQHQTEEKKRLLALTFLSGIGHDFLIIKAFGSIIGQTTENFDQSTWAKALKGFEIALNKVKDEWAPVLDPTGNFRAGKRSQSKKRK